MDLELSSIFKSSYEKERAVEIILHLMKCREDNIDSISQGLLDIIFDISPSTASRFFQKLEAYGYIERTFTTLEKGGRKIEVSLPER